MTLEETEQLLDNYNLEYQNQWNQTRFICYINALLQGNKFKSPKDLIEFSWEKSDVDIEPEDPEVVKERMMSLLNSIS